MTGVRENWERRAGTCGSDLAGVLFRNLSTGANQAIHQWHWWIVRNVFLPKIPRGGRLLDLGGGYGRIGALIRQARPDIELVGQDLAWSYCCLYQGNVGICVQASMSSLPFGSASFDGVLAITCLMYEGQELPRILAGISEVLKPAGALLALDPGREMQQFISRFRGKKAESPTGGTGFGLGEYTETCSRSGFRVERTGGNPLLSMALLVPGVATSKHKQMKTVLSWFSTRDQALRGYNYAALHRWVLAIKKPATT